MSSDNLYSYERSSFQSDPKRLKDRTANDVQRISNFDDFALIIFDLVPDLERFTILRIDGHAGEIRTPGFMLPEDVRTFLLNRIPGNYQLSFSGKIIHK